MVGTKASGPAAAAAARNAAISRTILISRG
jgi:hypothetical protein